MVTKLERPVPFSVPPVGKRPPTGKKVIDITCTLPLCTNNLSTATQKLGWKFNRIEYDLADGPQAYATAFDQALQEKPNYILAVGIFPPTLVSKQLAEAAADHIPVISITGLSNNTAIKACVSCASYLGEEGAILLDEATADGAEGSQVLYVGDPTVVGSLQDYAGMTREAARLHIAPPRQLSLSSSATQAADTSAVISYLQSHSSVKVVLTALSSYLLGLPPALSQTGLASRIKYYTGGPQTPDLGFVKSGAEAATVAIMNDAAAWSALDQAVRLSVGQAPDPVSWFAIATKENLGSILAANSDSSRPEPPNYEETYFKAWGVG